MGAEVLDLLGVCGYFLCVRDDDDGDGDDDGDEAYAYAYFTGVKLYIAKS